MTEKTKALKQHIKTNPEWYWLLAVIFLFPLLPEYLSPFILFAGFIVFIINWKKIGNRALLGKTGKALLVYMGYMVISGIWSETHILSSLIGLLWMGCFLIYVYISNAVNTKEKMKNAITMVNISAGIIGFVAIVEIVTYNLSNHFEWFDFIFPNPLFYDINDIIYDAFPIEIVNNKYSSRASSTFDNPLILATYLVITTPFCAFGSVYFRHSKNRKISRVCLLFAIGGIVCTSSRSAYAAVAISIIAILISTGNKKVFNKIIPFAFILITLYPFGLFLRYKNSSAGSFAASTEKRFDIWKSCFDMIIKKPLTGYGAGTENVHTMLRDTYGIDRTHAHNFFIEMLVEGGIIGGIFIVLITAIIVRNIYLIMKNKDKVFKNYAVLYNSSLLGFLTMSLFEFTMQSPKELMIFFLLLGFIEATYRISTHTHQSSNRSILSYEEIPDKDIRKERINQHTA